MTSTTTTLTDAEITAGVQTALEQLFAGIVPDPIVANARELAEIRAAKSVLEKRESVLRDVLNAYLDATGKDAAEQNGVAIFRNKAERSGVNMDRMKALYPTVLDDVATTTPYSQLRVEIKG